MTLYYVTKSEDRQQQNANLINHTVIKIRTKLKKKSNFYGIQIYSTLLFSHLRSALNLKETLGKKKCEQPLARRNRKSCVTLFF